jgi:hypothetical protein
MLEKFIDTNFLHYLAPLEEIAPHIRKYWDRELDDVRILARLKDLRLFDTEKYGLA